MAQGQTMDWIWDSLLWSQLDGQYISLSVSTHDIPVLKGNPSYSHPYGLRYKRLPWIHPGLT